MAINPDKILTFDDLNDLRDQGIIKEKGSIQISNKCITKQEVIDNVYVDEAKSPFNAFVSNRLIPRKYLFPKLTTWIGNPNAIECVDILFEDMPPTAPYIYVTNPTFDELDVDWSVNPGTDDVGITSYIVYYKKSIDSTWIKSTLVDGIVRQTKISGVLGSTSYDVRILARDYLYNQTYSNIVTIVTKEEIITLDPTPPTTLTLAVAYDEGQNWPGGYAQLKASWSGATYHRGLKHYKIIFRYNWPASNSDMIFYTNQTSIYLGYLYVNREYSVKVVTVDSSFVESSDSIAVKETSIVNKSIFAKDYDYILGVSGYVGIKNTSLCLQESSGNNIRVFGYSISEGDQAGVTYRWFNETPSSLVLPTGNSKSFLLDITRSTGTFICERTKAGVTTLRAYKVTVYNCSASNIDTLVKSVNYIPHLSGMTIWWELIDPPIGGAVFYDIRMKVSSGSVWTTETKIMPNNKDYGGLNKNTLYDFQVRVRKYSVAYGDSVSSWKGITVRTLA